MKYIRQLGIILLVSFLGELLHYLLPLPVPASIYGIVLLFAALETRLLKADAIRETSAFLLEIMPMLFVPAGVGLSTFTVFAAAGCTTQRVMRLRQKREDKR